jgi:hypothetical protein
VSVFVVVEGERRRTGSGWCVDDCLTLEKGEVFTPGDLANALKLDA